MNDSKELPARNDLEELARELARERRARRALEQELELLRAERQFATECMQRSLRNEVKQRRRSEDLERRSTAASLAKSEFLSIVSHELRTPLNHILGNAQIAQMDLDAGEAMGESCVEQIMQAGLRLLRLVDDIISYAQCEKEDAKVGPFLARNLISNLEFQALCKARDKGIGVRFEIEDGLPDQLNGRAERLHDLLSRLLDNAIKFTSKGEVGLAVSRVCESEGKVLCRFLVWDEGQGIEFERLERLFDPFCQADGSASRQYEGLGIGLALCWKLSQLLGGHIVMGRNRAGGCTFSLVCPLGKSGSN